MNPDSQYRLTAFSATHYTVDCTKPKELIATAMICNKNNVYILAIHIFHKNYKLLYISHHLTHLYNIYKRKFVSADRFMFRLSQSNILINILKNWPLFKELSLVKFSTEKTTILKTSFANAKLKTHFQK